MGTTQSVYNKSNSQLLSNKSKTQSLYYQSNKIYGLNEHQFRNIKNINLSSTERMIFRFASIFIQLNQNILRFQNKTINNNMNYGFIINQSNLVIKYLTSMYGKNSIVLLAKYIESKINSFYVFNVADGILLRKNGIKKKIIVLNYINLLEINDVEKYNLCIIVPNINYLTEIITVIKNKINIYLFCNFDDQIKNSDSKASKKLADVMVLNNLIKKEKNINKKINILGIKIGKIRYEHQNKLHTVVKLITGNICLPYQTNLNYISKSLKSNNVLFNELIIGPEIYKKISWTTPIISIKKNNKTNKNIAFIKLLFNKTTLNDILPKINEKITIFALDTDNNNLVKLKIISNLSNHSANSANNLINKGIIGILLPNYLLNKLHAGNHLIIKMK